MAQNVFLQNGSKHKAPLFAPLSVYLANIETNMTTAIDQLT